MKCHVTSQIRHLSVPVQYRDRGVTAPGLFSWSAAATHPPGGTGATHTAPCSEKPHKDTASLLRFPHPSYSLLPNPLLRKPGQ